jgi:hypothetical protein
MLEASTATRSFLRLISRKLSDLQSSPWLSTPLKHNAGLRFCDIFSYWKGDVYGPAG